AVNSPAVKLLYDVYHQQITEGNLIARITQHIDKIGHIHIADVPGRHEPGTGEINYANVLKAIADAGYQGYVGLEFRLKADARVALENVRKLGEAS
ncbi:MAG TPA: TIM barrel protein, partial [Limnochordia bacterium]|nr:TIM barrel protein [Limnochordia bacterium]